MASNSAIEWTDATWTPIRARAWEIQADGSGKERIGWHCEHVSDGCRNCYAEKINLRLGTGFEFKPGNLRGRPGYSGGGVDRPELFLDEKMLLAPLRWKKPRMIFVCSMTDGFADFVKDEWLELMFAVMALCPQHTFQVLTKRAERMRQWFSNVDRSDNVGLAMLTLVDRIPYGHRCVPWPLPNVWLGISAERQQEADERVPHLLQTPAAVRFVSAEPLLGPIDFLRIPGGGAFKMATTAIGAVTNTGWHQVGIHWVIVGGESGQKARPMHPQWARDIRDQCIAAGVPFFFKQWGEWAAGATREWPRDQVADGSNYLAETKTVFGAPAYYALTPEPSATVRILERFGKKAAGRLLDGVTHDGFPEVTHALS